MNSKPKNTLGDLNRFLTEQKSKNSIESPKNEISTTDFIEAGPAALIQLDAKPLTGISENQVSGSILTENNVTLEQIAKLVKLYSQNNDQSIEITLHQVSARMGLVNENNLSPILTPEKMEGALSDSTFSTTYFPFFFHELWTRQMGFINTLYQITAQSYAAAFKR